MADIIEKKIINKKMFSSLVEEYVWSHDTPYIEAVVEVCASRELDPSQVASLLSNSIKDKVEAEAMAMNYLPKVNALPL